MLTPQQVRIVSSTEGVRVPVYDFGGDGPLLLVAHATGFHGRVYDPMLAAMPGFWKVSADLRGHGDARVPEGLDFRWESFTDDLVSILDDLAAEGPVFGFGHSMGGACLLMLEERRPGTFAGLFCYEPVIDPTAPRETPEEEERLELWVARTSRRRSLFPSRSAALDNYRDKGPYARMDQRALEAYVDHGFGVGEDGSLELKCRPEAEAQMYRMGPRHRTFEELGSVRCPVVIARGGLIEPGPGMRAAMVAEAIPGGRLLTFDGLGHMGPLEDPERVAKAVVEAFAG